jgi:hypothetical protein
MPQALFFTPYLSMGFFNTNATARGTIRWLVRSSAKNNLAKLRARDAMTDDFRELEGTGLPGPMGEIPKKLRQYYDSLQEEAIPERLLDLLEKLDQAERAQQPAVREPSVEELK